MNFIDENITFDYTPSTTGYFTYTVSIGGTLVYTGNFYGAAGVKTLVDITDILANYRYINPLLDGDFSRNFVQKSGVIANVSVRVGTTGVYGRSLGFIYRNQTHNYHSYIEDAWEDTTPASIDVLPLLQTSYIAGTFDCDDGKENYGLTKAIPHYPFISTSNYGMIHAFFVDSHDTDMSPLYLIGNRTTSIPATETSGNTNVYRSSLSSLFYNKLPYADTIYFSHDGIYSSTNFLSNMVNAERWNVEKDDYVYDESMYNDSTKTITVPMKADYLLLGFLRSNGTYSDTYRFDCNEDTHTIAFTYDPVDMYRIEFSFRDNGQSGAANNEIAIISFMPLLTKGQKYIITFTHTTTDTSVVSSIYIRYDRFVPIAKLDAHPAKYYLMWQDRLGGIQSQSFYNKDTFSEDFKYTSVEDFRGHKRNANVEIQAKWELNTGWIPEDIYPIYESIFISHKVLLYNTEIDRLYTVIPSDKSYTEKTHKNQRNLFKLNLKLELDKKQIIMS